MMAGAAGHFLGPMIVNPNQCRPASLPIISDGPFLPYQLESMSFKQSHQFTEFQMVSYSLPFMTRQFPNAAHADTELLCMLISLSRPAAHGAGPNTIIFSAT